MKYYLPSLIMFVCLAVTYSGTHSPKIKRINFALVFNRLCLLILFGYLIYEIINQPSHIFTWIHLIYLGGLSWLMESCFTQLRTTFGRPFLNWSVYLGFLIGIGIMLIN